MTPSLPFLLRSRRRMTIQYFVGKVIFTNFFFLRQWEQLVNHQPSAKWTGFAIGVGVVRDGEIRLGKKLTWKQQLIDNEQLLPQLNQLRVPKILVHEATQPVSIWTKAEKTWAYLVWGKIDPPPFHMALHACKKYDPPTTVFFFF